MKAAILFIGLLFVLAWGYLSYFDSQVNDVDPISVAYIEVKREAFVSSISTTGRIISRKVETVKSARNGIVLDQGYQNRDFVRKGKMIAKIRLVEQEYKKKQQQLRVAEIDLEILRAELQHAEELYQAKAISERELKEIKNREYKQQINVSDIKEELADEPVLASFDGMIVNKKFVQQAKVFDNTELFTLIDPGDIYVELPIFQKDMPKVHIGQVVNFTNTVFKGNRQGEVIEISPMATPAEVQNVDAAATFNVYASINVLPEDPILFGSNVDAEIVLEKKWNVISVPLEAILYHEDQRIVYVIEKERAQLRIVRTGQYNENLIEIIAGLEEGEKLITRGNLEVEDGLTIIMKPDEEKRNK